MAAPAICRILNTQLRASVEQSGLLAALPAAMSAKRDEVNMTAYLMSLALTGLVVIVLLEAFA